MRQDDLKHLTQQIALAEPAVAVLGEGGVIRNGVRQIEAAEPTIGQVEMDLFADPTLERMP